MINLVITLKWTLLVITLTQANADDTHGIERRDTNADAAKKIVCYYTNWSVYRPGTAKFSPQNINPYLCTHLIYAFGGLDKENGLRPYDKYQDIEQGGYAKFTGLKTYNKNLKTMLAIGGWNEGSSKFSPLVADDERRAIFVKNVVKFLRQNNFDGLDLDWEYPAFRDGSKPDDKDNYASLVKELREEFEKESSKTGRPRLLLTMAVPAGVEYIDKGYDVPRLNKYLDFMNILSYDYHSAYEPNVNHHSPLYSLQEESEYNFDAQLTIDHTVNHYLKKGVDREKLILGIPTYGRSYTLFNADSTDLGSPADGPGEQGEATREKGYLAYYEICANLENDQQWKIVQPKKSAMGPYAFKGNQWVSYDDADIVKLKAKYVNEKGLGGIMYWSIDNDDFRGKCHGKPYPLIEAGKESLLASAGSSSANAISSSTSDEKRSSKFANKRNRPKSQNTNSISTTTKQPTTTSTSVTSNPLSTPEPPTTPDPGTDFVCKEEGFFPHPRDCKKYFWCLDSGPSNLGIVAHQFTCPSGLMFNKAADSCDYSRNVICNKKSEKSSTTASSTAKTTTSTTSQPGTKISVKTTTSTTTSTTTTTEPTPSLTEEDYEDVEDVDSQEDPKAIKQLITLIKKLGGIAELEKQLKLEDGSVEVTTPAISKNLYNKVFSSPSSTRYKNQYRNGPSSPQRETINSNDDVPYYRREKPQYVTIQRSRPLKNVAQDAEDSGTTNNKSVQPGKYEESVDYADDVTQIESETTTHKYSSPRYRTSVVGADSRGSTLKYITLERNKFDRTTTTDAEELKPELPVVTTQRYITLVRQKPSPVTEYEEVNTEETLALTQKSSTTQPKSQQTDSPNGGAEKPREKVSETTSATSTNLPDTSAQYTTDRVGPVYSLTSTLKTLDNVATTPKTYVVFSRKVVDESQRRGDDDVESATTTAATTTDYVTEILVPLTSTTVITTIRESSTRKTRISLKRYKEYLKNNRTDLLNQIESESNEISVGNSPLPKVEDSTILNGGGGDSTTSGRTTVSAKRFRYTSPANKENSTPYSSRFFLRRNKNVSSTIGTSVEANATEFTTAAAILSGSRGKLAKTSVGNVIEEKGDEDADRPTTLSKPKNSPRFRFKYRNSTAAPESDSIASLFARRRLPTSKQPNLTSERSIEASTVSVDSATTKASRYFTKSRKTFSHPTTEQTEIHGKNISDTTIADTNVEVRSKVTQSEILDSDENRYEIPRTSTLSDSESTKSNIVVQGAVDSIATTTVFEPKSTLASNETSSSSPLPPQVDGDDARTRIVIRRPLKNETRAQIREPFKSIRNNSRFLKNPEPEYVGEARNSTSAVASNEKVHRFGGIGSSFSPPPRTRGHNRIEYTLRDVGDDSTTTDAAAARRGRKKFSDGANQTANLTIIVVDNVATAKNSRNNSVETRPRFRQTNTAHFTTPTYEPAVQSSTSAGSSRYEDSNSGRSGSRFSTGYSHSTRASHRNSTGIRENVTATIHQSLENEFREANRILTLSTVPVTAAAISTTDDWSRQHQSRGQPRFYRPSNRTAEIPTATSGRSTSRHVASSNVATPQSNRSGDEISQVMANANVTRNRGKIKAQNSLSRSEIRELTSLRNSPPQPESNKAKKKPTPIFEENFTTNVFNGNIGVDSTNAYATAAGAIVVPVIIERSFEETTDDTNAIYSLDDNSIANTQQPDDADVELGDHSKNTLEIFGASETKYTTNTKFVAVQEDGRQRTQNSSDFGNERTSSADQSEPSSRYRENFRRTTSPRSRSRSTTSTTTTEYSTVSNESAKLANRFRRRKIKPENRSIGTISRNENSPTFSYPIETSTTKPKKIDISQRGSTTISDFLPVPASLYIANSTSKISDISYNIGVVNQDDLEAQNINTRTNYYNTEDVSDLAHPAVVAIHNLKTVPPASAAATQQLSYSKTSNSLSFVPPQITFTEEISSRPFTTLKATAAPTVLPISNSRPSPSNRRGMVRLSSKKTTTTTTRIPSLQDIYNDYHETDLEYHADPVEIPITGKVRIHSDGYIECLDMGNFPHPFSCKKFISCAKMDYDSLLGWEYTCPKGLSFDPIGGICNWAAGLGCKE